MVAETSAAEGKARDKTERERERASEGRGEN